MGECRWSDDGCVEGFGVGYYEYEVRTRTIFGLSARGTTTVVGTAVGSLEPARYEVRVPLHFWLVMVRRWELHQQMTSTTTTTNIVTF